MIIESITLKNIADAIRAKTGSTAKMTPVEMPGKIASIPSGGETQSENEYVFIGVKEEYNVT